MKQRIQIGGLAVRKTTAEINRMVSASWLDGYNHGANDCAADYECGLREVGKPYKGKLKSV